MTPAPIQSDSGRRRARRGFTLIEALATLVLVAIVLPVAMRGIAMATRTASDAARQSRAIALAEGKLAELIVTQAWNESVLEGDFTSTASGMDTLTDDPDLEAYTWRATVDDWLDQSVQELTVYVQWEQADVTREVSVTTLVRAQTEGL